MSNFLLSPNFSLTEMLASQTATRFEYNEQFNPPQHIVENLRLLCTHVLQPLRDYLGYPIKVNSGYRCKRVNDHIGGSQTSQHMRGQAADIVDTYNGNGHLLRAFLQLGVPYDQVIDEFGLSWVHISYDHFKHNRFQRLRAVKNSKGKTVYLPMS